MELDAVADELYGLTPGEFTSAREARAGEARQSGDRGLAAAIKKLRRPTTSAWLVNRLVRDRLDELHQLLELGEATRQAHANLDRDDLRRLSRQRRQAIGVLSQDGRLLARGLGQPVSEAVGRELEATLEAAFADPDACEAVRSGRLTSSLSYSGLGPMDAPEPPVPPAASMARKPAKAASKTTELDEVDRQRRKRSETAAVEALQDAQAAADRARSEVEEHQHRLADARDLLELRRREVSDLEHQLQERSEARDRATDDVGQAEEAHADAERRVRVAADDLARAQADLDELRR